MTVEWKLGYYSIARPVAHLADLCCPTGVSPVETAAARHNCQQTPMHMIFSCGWTNMHERRE